jgi:hypothetical protein
MNNHETERARLAQLYSKMSDDELAHILADEKSLTEIARVVLAAELSSRGSTREQPAEFAAAAIHAQEDTPEEFRAPQYSGPLAVVKRFRDLPEAVVAKSILDSAEIDSFLADENIVRLDWFYSNLVGGAKLMVRPQDLEEATTLLIEANLTGSESSNANSDQPGEQSE